MYNEELKQRFILEFTQSDANRKLLIKLFNNIEKHELQWGADFCTRSSQELEPMLGDVLGIRSNSRTTALSALRAYVKWCIQNNVPGAVDGLTDVTVDGSSKIRNQMVQSPLQLQRYLNAVYEPEDSETIDVLYRCYLWCAYIGIDEDLVLDIKISDVDLRERTVSVGGRVFYFYKEADLAFRKALELESFNYSHKNYGTIRRDRNEGDTLFRGYKGETKLRTLRAALTGNSALAVKEGKTQRRLTYDKTKLSGLFFRIYERECNGFDADFQSVASAMAEEKRTQESSEETVRLMRVRKEWELKKDYNNWKTAFML